jgi:hypothetical protein
MASSSRAHRMGEPTTLFDSFMFDNLGLMPLSVSLLLSPQAHYSLGYTGRLRWRGPRRLHRVSDFGT